MTKANNCRHWDSVHRICCSVLLCCRLPQELAKKTALTVIVVVYKARQIATKRT